MNPLADLVGGSPAMEAVRRDVHRLLAGRLTGRRLPSILIEGETGTGKGLVARILHRGGPRAAAAFVDVNCAAIPETLLEAELFGFERGAFTDARRSKPGLFQAAHRGTIFLDEVGLLAEGLQAKLLSVLEERSVRRLGATTAEPVDVWVLSATNADLRAATRERRFREDLYHRLAVLTLRLPPLRQRGRDVLLLAERFLARACQEYGLTSRRLGPDAETALLAYHWPGNVRELGNVIERVALLSEREVVSADMLGLEFAEPPASDVRTPGAATSAVEAAREHLRAALEQTGWNISHTAAALGLSRNTIRARIARYRLERRRGRDGPPPRARTKPRVSLAPPPSADAVGSGTPAATTGGVRWGRRRVVFLRVRVGSDPESAAPATARLLDRCVDKILGFGGRLEEISRRHLLAAFGTEAAEDAPRRALNVALVIRNLLARDRQGAEASSLEAAAAIGLHARHVMVTHVGARVEIDQDDRLEATRALDALEPLAESEITVSDAAADLLGGHVELRRDGAAGRPGSAVIARDPRFAPGTPLVGRRPEIEALGARLERAADGHGQVVAIVGEPGIGKSRVVREFLRTLSADTATTLTGRCAAYGANVPYFAVVDMLQTARAESDGTPSAAQEAEQRTERADLEALLDPRRAGGLRESSPEAVKARTFDAIRRMLLARQERAPLVLVVEDLHWVDPTSEELLLELTDVIVNHRILLVTTSRPGYRAPWSGRSHVTQLALGPLSEAESRALIVSLLDREAADREAVVARIVSRAEGNPFFLEELVRTVRPGAERDARLLPITVSDVIAARIDALPEADRQLLRLAAVIGRDVPSRVLEAAAARPADVVRDGLTRLQSLEFLYAARFAPATEYAFKHALTCEAAYESIPCEERGPMHMRVARAIETVLPDTGERRPETLARHYAAAGRAREAVELLRRAGELAVRRSANAEAVAHLEQALGLLPKGPADAAVAQAELQIRIALASALAAHRGFGSVELEATLARISELIGQAGYSPDLAPVRFNLWRFALARADFDAAERLVTELRTTVAHHPEPGLLVAAHAAAGMTAFYLGRLDEARRAYEIVAARTDAEREKSSALVYGQDLGVGPLGYLGWTRTLMGQCDLGAETADRALARAREGGHPFTIAHALNIAGLVRCDRREAALVARHGEEMLTLAREGRFPFLTALALMLVGWSRVALGDAGAVALMWQGHELYRGAQQRVGLRPRAQLAEALATTGDLATALEVADTALADARATRDDIYRSELLRVKGEALARRPAQDAAALACLEDAVRVATAQGASLLALRAATSLVRAQRARTGEAPALDLLRSLYGRFSEGLGLADLKAAHELVSAHPSRREGPP